MRQKNRQYVWEDMKNVLAELNLPIPQQSKTKGKLLRKTTCANPAPIERTQRVFCKIVVTAIIKRRIRAGPGFGGICF